MANHQYDVIIIGSGMAGLSSAIHLANRGQRVVVLEQATLASGATSRASGLIGQMRSSSDATRLVMTSLRFIREVEARTDTQVFNQTGSIRLAQNQHRVDELEADTAIARDADLECETVDAAWLGEHLPFMRSDDVLTAAYCPTDGYLNPPELAEAYIALAKSRGVEFRERCRVEEILTKNNRVTGVRANAALVNAPIVINAAGPWAHLIADVIEQRLPTAGIIHRYFTTCPEAGDLYPSDAPTVRDRDLRIYARPKDGALRVGIYERAAEGFDMEAAGRDFLMESLQIDSDHATVRSLIDAAADRFPEFKSTTPIDLTGGVMAFSPDGNSLIGTIPDLEGFYHAAGLCGHGVAQSGELGAIVADLILDNTCRYNLDELRADRFDDLPELRTREQAESACEDAYGAYYGR